MEKKLILRCGAAALVDEDMYEEVSQFQWRLAKTGGRNYVARSVRGRHVFLHRVINETPDGMFTDHINGDGLDNRKSNLRTVTHAQNMKNRKMNSDNTSGYKGVYLDKESGRYRAQITSDGKVYRLGRFSTPEEASEAYAKAAEVLHGEFSRRAIGA